MSKVILKYCKIQNSSRFNFKIAKKKKTYIFSQSLGTEEKVQAQLQIVQNNDGEKVCNKLNRFKQKQWIKNIKIYKF